MTKKKVKGEKLGRQFWFFSKGRGVCFVFKKDERGGRARFRPVEKNKFRVLFFFFFLVALKFSL